MLGLLGLGSSKPPRGLKWRSNTIFIVFTVGMAMSTDLCLYAFLVPVLPFMLKDRIGLPESEIQSTISNLLAFYAGASLIASPITGVLADKLSKSRQLPFVLGLVMLIFGTILLALGQTVPVLALARLLQGASAGVVWTIGLAILIETVSHENLGTTMGTIFGFISVATLFSPILGGVLYAKTGYIGVFGAGIALIVIDVALRLIMIEKKVAARFETSAPQTNANSVRHDTEQTPLLSDGISTPGSYRLSEPKNRITKALPFLMLLRNPALLTALWLGFMQALLLGSLDATIPLMASELFGFDSLKASLLFLPDSIPDLLLGPVFGWCVDRYGTKYPSVLGFTWLIPSLVLLRLTTTSSITDHLDKGRHIALYAGLLAMNGVGLAAISAPGFVESGDLVDKYSQANEDLFEQPPYAQLYGVNSMIWSAGLTIGPLLAGSLREKIGYGNMNAVLAGFCLLTAIFSGLYIGNEEDDQDVVEIEDE